MAKKYYAVKPYAKAKGEWVDGFFVMEVDND